MKLHVNTIILLFLFSDFITQFGAGVLLTSTNWYVLDVTGSNTMVALVAAANTLSGLLASLFGGMLSDRYGPGRIALVSHVIRVTLVIVPLLLLMGFGFHIGFMLLLVLNNGIGWNLYYPASRALIQRIAGGNVTRVNSAAEVSMQVGLFASGALAGVLYHWFGFVPIMAVSCIMFAAGILALLLLIRLLGAAPRTVREVGSTGVWNGLRDGVLHLTRDPQLAGLCIVLYAPFIIGNVNQTLLPGYVQIGLRADSVTFGFIQCLWGVGACAAGLTVSMIGQRVRSGRMVWIGLLVLTGFSLVLWLFQSLPVTGMLTLLGGFADAMVRITLYSRLMLIVSPIFFGRVLSLMNAVSLLLQTMMAQAAGVLMDWLSPSIGYMLVFAGMLLILLLYGRVCELAEEYHE